MNIHTYIHVLNHNFLTFAKSEIQDLTVCFAVTDKKNTVTLDLDQIMPNAESA